MVGKFYLGLNYDYQQIWMQNQFSKSSGSRDLNAADSRAKESGVAIYLCSQQKEYISFNQKQEKIKKMVIIDVYIVISESVFLVLEPEPKMKGIGKLVSWGTLPTIDSIKRNLDNPDMLTVTWRKVGDREPWTLSILLPNNANDCVNLILKHLKKQGLIIDKKYQKKKKLKESEVTAASMMQPSEVEMLLKTIQQYEYAIAKAKGEESKEEVSRTSESNTINPSTVQHLISLYNKAIEYYSVMNDQRLEEFLGKLKNVLLDEKMQKILEASDKGIN